MGIDKPGPEEEIGGAPGDFPLTDRAPQDHPEYWKAQVRARPNFKEEARVPFAAYSRERQEESHAEIVGRRLEREADPERYFRKQSKRIRRAVETKLEKYSDLVEINDRGDEVLELGLHGGIKVARRKLSTGGESYEIRIRNGDQGEWFGFTASERDDNKLPVISEKSRGIGDVRTEELNTGNIDNYGLQTALQIVEAAESSEVERAKREQEDREFEERKRARAEAQSHQRRSRFSLRRNRSRSRQS